MREMNRREMLKMSSTGALAALASAVPGVAAAHGVVPKWEVFELSLEGPSTGNPFTEVELTGTFALGHRTVAVDGFYDGMGKYKIRFMPDEEGDWSYTTKSGAHELHGKTGTFACVRSLPGSHGPVRVRNMHHFAYADGTAYFPFGTTCYAWVHQGEELERQTLSTLRASPFNKIRMCVFPKSYEYLDPDQPFDENTTPTLWWSHGGTLHGTSPARIAFLRRLVEETAGAAGTESKRAGLEAGASPYYLNASSMDATGQVTEEIVYYMDLHQPIYYEFPLPDGSFTAELIDPLRTTVTAVPGRFSGKTKLKLSGRPYQAVRFRRTS